ncbi:MAG: ATP-binding cassette domain-containing protein [Elusimicrobiales bacterium]|nr:ATP-binding cassette domain-containing protein [Elusimicrobiales bacterium]
MIKVKGVRKFYDKFEALKGISFEINSSKITALLGPNGAGKTTTLRILSGYLNYDDGEIEFFNKKLTNQNLKEIKKDIGYIPENNPLYDDIEVCDFLEWIASIYKTDKNSVKDAINKCSLKDACGKKISTLSKGYRQRLSLAKAIIHNPKILLLDEPTTGLDPNQARQTRELIKNLSYDKTIVISTHILSEVEALADDIIIINKGEIAEFGTKQNIINKYIKNSYILKTNSHNLNLEINNLKNISYEKFENEFIYKFEFEGNEDMRKIIIEILKNKNIEILEFYREKMTLDEIFRNITEN